MAEEVKPFRVVKELSELNVVSGVSPNDWDLSPTTLSNNEGWVKIDGNTFLCTATIDLRGITEQEKTLFFSTQFLQRAGVYGTLADFATTGGEIILDSIVVSDVPLDDLTATTTSAAAGFNVSPDDYVTVKLGEMVTVAQNNAIPLIMSIVDAGSYGSGDPTASNKLYLYRWCNLQTTLPIAAGISTFLPAVRYVGIGVSAKEKDLVWMMRLKRSFEAQQQ